MLVLSRRRNSEIQIGANVQIIVLEIHKGRVKLGIQAPSGVSVQRGVGLPNVSRGMTPATLDARSPATADATV